MKIISIVFLVVALLGFVMACRDHVPKESVKKDYSDKPETNIVVKQSISPLMAGEFHLEEKDFGEIIELQGECRSVKEIFRVEGSEMLIKDDILTIKNPIDTDMFMQYKLPELKFIRSFGKMGQGPGEFIYPSIVTTEEKIPLFYMFDGAKTGFCYLDRENQIKEIDFRFPHSFTGATPIHFFNNHEFVYAATTSKGKAIFYCNFSGVQAKTREVYDLSFSKKHRNWGAYLGAFAASKKKDHLVYTYKYFKRLVFLNLAGSQVRIVDFKNTGPKPGDAVSMMGPEHVVYYWMLSVGEKFLYVSCIGKSILKVIEENKKSAGHVFIEQFDWDGNPIRKLRLDH